MTKLDWEKARRQETHPATGSRPYVAHRCTQTTLCSSCDQFMTPGTWVRNAKFATQHAYGCPAT